MHSDSRILVRVRPGHVHRARQVTKSEFWRDRTLAGGEGRRRRRAVAWQPRAWRPPSETARPPSASTSTGTPTTYVPWHLHELIVGGCRDRRKFSVQTGGSSRGFRVCCCSPPPGNCSARHTAPFGHGSLLTPPFRRPGLSPRPQLPRHRMDVD
jgi:hypothetical protein